MTKKAAIWGTLVPEQWELWELWEPGNLDIFKIWEPPPTLTKKLCMADRDDKKVCTGYAVSARRFGSICEHDFGRDARVVQKVIPDVDTTITDNNENITFWTNL